MGPALKPVGQRESPGKLQGPPGVRSFGGEFRCRGRHEAHGRLGNAGSDPAETAAEMTSKVEHAEVKPGGCLHGDPGGPGRRVGAIPLHGAWTLPASFLRTKSVRSAMASRSLGPAVLSTTI